MKSPGPDARRYRLADFSELEPRRCPCGWTRRAYADDADSPASMHVVQIQADSHTHYHEKTTEIYYVLQGEGVIELDGEQIPLSPGRSVMILPHCRHRAQGTLTILNVAIPAFDPADEIIE